MVEVFKTNVADKQQAEKFLRILSRSFPNHKINFDLDDCDRILRVEGEDGITADIGKVMKEHGIRCETLD